MIANESVTLASGELPKRRSRIAGSSLGLNLKLSAAIVFVALGFSLLLPERLLTFRAAAEGAVAFSNGFPYSTPITLNSAGTELWVTNPDPDNNSVTVLDVTGDAGVVLDEITVGKEPSSIALDGDGSHAYVANAADGTVSVINTNKLKVTDTIRAGVEPRALCFTPNFTKLYVACASSNTIHVINPATNTVTRVIDNPGFSNLFALTITNDGDADDSDELVYVTNLLAECTEGSAPKPTSDLGKQGIVSVISVGSDALVDRVKLKPVKTLFQSDGRQENADFVALTAAEQADTFAFPNQLTSIAGTRQNGTNLIYTFSTGSSPTGPFKFNVNVQSLVAQIRGVDDAGQTANINDQIKAEPATAFATGVPKHRFATMPWGLAFFHNSFRALGAASACDYVIVIDFDQNGKATVTPNGPANIKRILTGTARDSNPDRSIFTDGKAPRGIAINQSDTRAYTFNYVYRWKRKVNIAARKPGAALAHLSLNTASSTAALCDT